MNEHGHWELLANYDEIEKIADEGARRRHKWGWCGLDGHYCWACKGPERNDCLKMAANILLSALPPDAGF
ncbi:MAG: hypothetical protein GWP05_02095 [Anaerolineaceae bacterium]|nr:hypothetical protein [Anaerolineaceae bacterium]